MKKLLVFKINELSKFIPPLISNMKFSMSRSIFKEFKIFRTIIILNAIFMMNCFFWFKIATRHFFHDKTRTFNISSLIAKWMIPIVDINVSIMDRFSALPFRMHFSKSFWIIFSDVSASWRTKFSSATLNFRFISQKIFLTNTTFLFHHSIAKLKSLCSACLEITVKLLTHTKRLSSQIKNPLFLNNNSIYIF